MSDLDYGQVIKELRDFRDKRGWRKYHTLPALSRALSIEVSEINEIFLWQDAKTNFSDKQLADLKLEMADALTYLYYMCDLLDVTPNELVQQKHDINVGRHWRFDQN